MRNNEGKTPGQVYDELKVGDCLGAFAMASRIVLKKTRSSLLATGSNRRFRRVELTGGEE